MLDISAVSVVIVIIAICDVPRQEFSFCERVYIHDTYMKSRKSCSETRKFRIKFPGRRVLNPSTIRGLAKRFKETGCVKNRNVNPRRHVSVSSVQRATKLLKLKPYKIPVVRALHQPDPNKRLRFCNWVLENVNSRELDAKEFF